MTISKDYNNVRQRISYQCLVLIFIPHIRRKETEKKMEENLRFHSIFLLYCIVPDPESKKIKHMVKCVR